MSLSLDRSTTYRIDPPLRPRLNKPLPSLPEDELQYPPWRTIAVLMAAFYVTLFLVALDGTIIATAIPQITDDFNSLDQVGWYGSAYMMCRAAFILPYGKLYKHYNPKWVLVGAVGLFEVGSMICGGAVNSTMLIVGRAIAGVGSAGIFTGITVAVFHLVPLRRRPAIMGLLGMCFALATVLGPLLGGAFTDRLSWRWCFFINLVFAGPTILVLIWSLRLPNPSEKSKPWSDKFQELDPRGLAAFLPSIITLLLALQWGGSKFHWYDARIIVLLTIFAALFATFIGIQIKMQERAMVPLRLLKQRSVAAGIVYAFFVGGSLTISSYYLPLWFQSVKSTSAVRSGISILPTALALTTASILAGFTTTKIGYYTPFMLASTAVASAGAGLRTRFQLNTVQSVWIGYQVIYGFGVGLGVQQPNVAAQTVLSKDDVPVGTAMIMFGQQLGSSIFVSAAENAFSGHLKAEIRGLREIDPIHLKPTAATDLRNHLPPEALDALLAAYNGAINRTWIIATTLSALSIIGALTMEWKSVKSGNKTKHSARTRALGRSKQKSSESAEPLRPSKRTSIRLSIIDA
ncbi:MAG: hypothetical protein Q9227_006759 [Pyrenula ochraceoflavens]